MNGPDCRECWNYGYTEEPFVFGMLIIYCTCPAGVAYKAQRMEALGLRGAA